MAEPDNALIYATLQKVQSGITDLRNGMADLRQDMRGLQEAQISTREEIQALRRDVLRQERGFAALQVDMDHVKNRLDPHHDA
jgi:predicted  nucleic acid-binding Zn-ribbon protein